MRLAVVGNATRDVIRAGLLSERRPGGTLLYATLALKAMGHEVEPIGHAPLRAYGWLRRSGVGTTRVKVAMPGTQFLNKYTDEGRQQWARRGPPSALASDAALRGYDGVLLGPVLGEVPHDIELPTDTPVLLDIQGTVRRLGERNVWGWREVTVTNKGVRFPKATHVHGSLEESRLVTGREDPEACVDALRERTGVPAVVTLGSAGAVTADQHRAWCRPDPIDVADPTGAGDVFDAGFLHGLATGAPLAECLVWGCATATIFLERTWTRRPLERFGSLDEVTARFEALAL